MDADRFRPPLTWRSHAWRYAICLAISGRVWAEVVQGQSAELLWLDLALGVACYALVGLRRRMPMTVAVATTAMAAMSGLAAGPATLAIVSLATGRVFWQVAVVGLVSVTSGQVFSAVQPVAHDDPYWVDLSVNVVATIAILSLGMYIGSRRELLWTLRDQVAQAEQERDLRVDQARSSERARIAREMHDVLAHRISQVSMHANALVFRDDLDASQMRESVAIIQEKANEALVDLRSVLGVLRDPDTGALLDKPQPTHHDIPELVAEARVAGVDVAFDDRLADGDQLPAVTGRTVYRIVQEGLTNARKHAPRARVEVCLTGSEEEGVDVEVRNPLGFPALGAHPPSGLGLIGLRERAELRGGRLEYGVTGSTFTLHGWIPWAT